MNKTAILASDMDGTVIPLESGEEREAEISEFNRLVLANRHVALAYVTGRHLELGLQGVAEHRLPVPDIFVCDVGTTIYFRSRDRWEVDQQYRSRLKDAWQDHTGTDIAAMLQGVPDLEEQEDERQKEFKQSYYVPRFIGADEIVAQIHARLGDEGVRANVIYSVDTLRNLGLVDVLPDIAAKDYALRYLWQRLELEFDRVVYAGDSGNDLLAFVSGFNAIIVANTSETVKEEVRRQAKEKKIAQRTYFAGSKYVRGVIEGCFHYQLFSNP